MGEFDGVVDGAQTKLEEAPTIVDGEAELTQIMGPFASVVFHRNTPVESMVRGDYQAEGGEQHTIYYVTLKGKNHLIVDAIPGTDGILSMNRMYFGQENGITTEYYPAPTTQNAKNFKPRVFAASEQDSLEKRMKETLNFGPPIKRQVYRAPAPVA